MTRLTAIIRADGARVRAIGSVLYEILSIVGEGGMGRVYRARDTKLQRQVAIKVLPDDVAGDPDRIARFEREARTLAALNHPHIAQIYGTEQSGGDARASDGARRRRGPRRSGIARGPIAVARGASRSRGRSPRRSKPRTSRASCIGI